MTAVPEAPLQTWSDEIRFTTKLSWPLILGQITQRLMLIINVVMMGHLGAKELACGTLAMAILNPILLCTGGILTAVAPLTAQAIGSGLESGGRAFFQQGIWLSLILSSLAIPLLYNTGTALEFLGQSPELSWQAGEFGKALCLMLPPYMVMLVARNFLAAHGQTVIALAILVVGAALNFAICCLIVENVWGLGQYGLFGIGLSTALANLAIAVALLFYISSNPHTNAVDPYHGLHRIDFTSLKAVSIVGMPIGGATLLEVAFFSASSLLMGYQGDAVLAAYALSGQLNGLAFAIPTGIGVAAMVRVGWAYGAGSWIAMQRACFSAIGMGVATGLCVGLTYALFPSVFISIFIDVTVAENDVLVRIATLFLYIVAVMQIVDAIQGIVSNVLRGMSDTFVPLLLILTGYWFFGFPLALILSGPAGYGGTGVYIGLLVGVVLVAVALTGRLFYRLGKMKEAAQRAFVPASSHELPVVLGTEIKDH
ncbi:MULTISPECIES: MATE family efflux transporter [Rhizobium/Agrobacterium group]|uniref:MATE family efflux transporter n=1 Tax=Rhizobium/Agrobacterium group TaxID=227290 RepID=UPI0014368617|nr:MULTISPECIES: MATE family efflux transporter [Rhizobium/Agrobacterium group]MBB4403155.1 MATE family multidrug resistance protein [Agrobacterium radiobacter]MBB5588935.1 MATE family multidrug resistance protein [Agrobacterium radiobacter]